jgi:hypothetical protein
MVAIELGHFQVVQYLVTQGADVDAKNNVNSHHLYLFTKMI